MTSRGRESSAIAYPMLLRLLLVLLGVLVGGAAAADRPVTFSRDVAPLLQQHCQECHRPGGGAPFTLTEYTHVYRRRDKILESVEKRLMPPWKAVAGYGDLKVSAACRTPRSPRSPAGSPRERRKAIPGSCRSRATLPPRRPSTLPTSCCVPSGAIRSRRAPVTFTAASAFRRRSPKIATSARPVSCPVIPRSSITSWR